MLKRIQCKVIKTITQEKNTGLLYESDNIMKSANCYLGNKYTQPNDSKRNHISFGYYIKFISALSVPDDGIGQFLDSHF